MALSPPTEEDIATLCQRVAQRITRLCAVGGDDEPFVDDDDAVMASVQAEALRRPRPAPSLLR